MVYIRNHANFDSNVLLYSNETGQILAKIDEKHSWLVKAERSFSSTFGNVMTIDDWFRESLKL